MVTAQIVVAGSGSYVPDTIVTNEQLVQFVGRKTPEWIEKNLGIRERRFMAPFDAEGYPLHHTDELDMAEAAARSAVKSADMALGDVDGLILISCTPEEPRQRLSRMVFDLHTRLNLNAECRVDFRDLGCGGFVHSIVDATELLKGSDRRTMLVVASNAPSLHFGGHREAYLAGEAWLSSYIFGDGAAAILLRKEKKLNGTSGIIASYLGVDGTQPLMEYARRGNSNIAVYAIDAHAVNLGYKKYTRAAMEGLKRRYGFKLEDVSRFYFHQANGRLLEALIKELDIPTERVARRVEIYGNTSAAATGILFDEDRRSGSIMPGELALFCTIGAGTQYGAMLVSL
ncbi:MAG: 3-oxoacyl-[acyl-carrier-protein] synthase III C-terminal domain-containing protein [bacterium]|nr:3-oxoacyl-[acyl-carrier-protein] synthase III C-terminal domain-containing protein [bacterium]